MALNGTYDGLKASVADFLNRGDLTAVIPDFIALAEAQMFRKFAARQRAGQDIPRRLVDTDTLGFSDGATSVAVPSDFVSPLTLTIPDASTGDPVELDYLDLPNFRAVQEAACLTGQKPAYYTVLGSNILIYPEADAAYSATLTYFIRLDALSSTNWILTDHPDAYLYGALMQSAPYLADDPRIAVWGGLFNSAIEEICLADPMPTDKAQLRTEVSPQMIGSRRYGYNVNTDS